MGGVFLTPLAMNDVTAAEEILSTMLHHLGYDCDVWEVESTDGGPPGLEVTLGDDKEADALLGRDGDRLEDLQFLVNKLLRQRHPGPRSPETPQRQRCPWGHCRCPPNPGRPGICRR